MNADGAERTIQSGAFYLSSVSETPQSIGITRPLEPLHLLSCLYSIPGRMCERIYRYLLLSKNVAVDLFSFLLTCLGGGGLVGDVQG